MGLRGRDTDSSMGVCDGRLGTGHGILPPRMGDVVSSTEVGTFADGATASLRFRRPVDGQRELPLDGDVTIGRDPSCDVALPGERRVSAHHATIRTSPTGIRTLEDLGSGNGTFVNERRVEPGRRVALNAGDVIRFGASGPTAMFVVRSGASKADREEGTHALTLAHAETLHGSDGRLVFRDAPLVEIGRDPGCDVSVAGAGNRRVSARHARVRYDGRGYLLEDLGSGNGTFVNGERISTATLAAGDVIELGAGGPRIVVEGIEVPGDASSMTVEEMQARLEQVARASGASSRIAVAAVAAVAVVAVVAGLVWRDMAAEARAHDADLREVHAQVEEVRASEPVDLDATFVTLEERHAPALILIRTEYTIVRRSDGEALADGHTYGTGFVVSEQGHVVTNRHVLQPWVGPVDHAEVYGGLVDVHGEAALEVQSSVVAWPGRTMAFVDGKPALHTGYRTGSNERSLEVLPLPPTPQLIHSAPNGIPLRQLRHADDLALLRLHGLDLPPAAIFVLADEHAKPVNQAPVLGLGFPHGRDALETADAIPQAARGRVSYAEATLQLVMPVVGGNSGGPVLDAHDRVVGVIRADMAPGRARCIRAADVWAAVRTAGPDLRLHRPSSEG